MSTAIRFGGSNRKYVFKKGVFKIQPTKNTGFVQTDKALRLSNNQQLIIPYISDKEIVLVKYKKATQGYFGLLTNSNRNSVNTQPEQDVIVGLYEQANNFVIVGLKAKTVINCTVAYALANIPCTVDIYEIWTEKI